MGLLGNDMFLLLIGCVAGAVETAITIAKRIDNNNNNINLHLSDQVLVPVVMRLTIYLSRSSKSAANKCPKGTCIQRKRRLI